MKQGIYTITENAPLTHDVYRLTLAGDTSAFTAPGQFLDIRLPGYYLRRPISVCDWTDGAVTVIYKLLGDGTAALSRLPAGTALDVLTGLGNGFDTSLSGLRPLVAGGGVGIPPLYRLTKTLLQEARLQRRGRYLLRRRIPGARRVRHRRDGGRLTGRTRLRDGRRAIRRGVHPRLRLRPDGHAPRP